MGRLTAQKAYEFSIDAMKLLKDHGVKARWYVLGEGELREKLQFKINKLGLKDDFILMGARENPFPYYSSVISMSMQAGLREKASRFRRPRPWAVPSSCPTAAETGSRWSLAWTE